jgi:hypothetical protein
MSTNPPLKTSTGLDDVLVQGRRVELGQDKDLIDPGVKTIADGNINDSILSGQGDRRLATHFGQRIKSLASPAPHHNAQNLLHKVPF